MGKGKIWINDGFLLKILIKIVENHVLDCINFEKRWS